MHLLTFDFWSTWLTQMNTSGSVHCVAITGARFSKDPLLRMLCANNMRTPTRVPVIKRFVLCLRTCCGSSWWGLISTIKYQKSKTLGTITNEQREAVKQRELKRSKHKGSLMKGLWWAYRCSRANSTRAQFYKHVYQKRLAFTKVLGAAPHGCSAKLGLTACLPCLFLCVSPTFLDWILSHRELNARGSFTHNKSQTKT